MVAHSVCRATAEPPVVDSLRMGASTTKQALSRLEEESCNRERALLKERQQVFQEQFQADMTVFKNKGEVPERVHSPSNFSLEHALQSLEIDNSEENNAELEEFLQDSD
ncbi:unnamed protein product [Cyprideis torosa]|uniref:Uncharacterized protein n=1 Tax=Cyprideis torosa TaxID=163714 RepID=A0A7R8W930_9CRUS|nr:unnamed protein product [Cyprideis torosa]CAG0889310.1 unnamed protein product [Cyprideis torosa]